MKKILLLTVIAGVIVAAYYYIFSKNDFENKNPPSSVIISDEEKYAQSLSEKDVQKVVFYTLPERVLKPEFNGKVFCSDKVFGYDSDLKEKTVNVYLYAHCEEYYLKGTTVTLGSGVSHPVKLIFNIVKQNLIFNSLALPIDGNEYAASIKKIFPEKYADEAITGVDTSTLIPLPKTQADNYFKGKLEVYF